jgi:predicted DNA-binding transcriptional regulator AlpA
MTILSRMLNEREAAPLLGVSARTLQGWRVRGEGPAFIKLGRGPTAKVGYREADIAAWIESRVRTFTGATAFVRVEP